jgi:hypothetical protein
LTLTAWTIAPPVFLKWVKKTWTSQPFSAASRRILPSGPATLGSTTNSLIPSGISDNVKEGWNPSLYEATFPFAVAG